MSHALTDGIKSGDAQSPSSFAFQCPVTMYKAGDAPEGKQRRIAGVISTDAVDRQNEQILQDGLNFDEFLATGFFNLDHGGSPTDVLGWPASVKSFAQGDQLPDGTTASANCTWVEGYLLNTPKATEIWDLGKALKGTDRRLGYSVEGQIESRTGPNDSIITKARVRHVAITHQPVNSMAYLNVLARSIGAQQRLFSRSMSLADAQGSAGPVKPNRPYTGAGAGQVLSRESLKGARKKKNKSTTLTRSEAVAYVRGQVPGCSEALARAIVFKTLNP